MRCPRFLRLPCVLLWALFVPACLSAAVATYAYPETIVEGDLGTHRRSHVYAVTVTQGGLPAPAYVMFDRNQEPHGNLAKNPDNHWTNFSHSGEAIVTVTRRDGQPITACRVFPSKKALTAVIEGASAVIRVPDTGKPLQFWVDIDGLERDPLFVFADPWETAVPDRTAPDVAVVVPGESIASVRAKLTGEASTVVFAEGVHRWGTATDHTYAGYQLPLVSGKEIYLPGGAYIVGTFAGENQSDFTLHGRGVISGAGLDRLPGVPGIPYSMVYAGGNGSGQKLAGFVSLSSPHFHLTCRGQVDIENVKMLSWWHQTDGTVTGDHSRVAHCFFKVNDDNIKIYSDHCIHENNTIFHQINGAPFQFSWGGQYARHNVSRDTFILYSVFKRQDRYSNTAVIDVMNGRPGNVTEYNQWDGIYLDNGCDRLLGLRAQGGTIRHLDIRNVRISTGKQTQPFGMWSYLLTGDFEDIMFTGLTIDGVPITGVADDPDAHRRGLLWFQGDASALSFRAE